MSDSTPRVVFNINDQSIRDIIPSNIQPLDNQLYMAMTETGKAGIHYYSTFAELEKEYGAATFEEGSEYFSNSAYFAKSVMADNGIWFCRLIPPAALHASAVLWITADPRLRGFYFEVDEDTYRPIKLTEEPNNFWHNPTGYELQEAWGYDNMGVSIEIQPSYFLSEIDGGPIVAPRQHIEVLRGGPIVAPHQHIEVLRDRINSNDFNRYSEVGGIGDGVYFPLMIIKSKSAGSGGNNYGVEIFYDPAQNPPERVTRLKHCVYSMKIKHKTPNGVKEIRDNYGQTVTHFTFVDAIDPDLNINMGIQHVIERRFSGDYELPIEIEVAENFYYSFIAGLGDHLIGSHSPDCIYMLPFLEHPLDSELPSFNSEFCGFNIISYTNPFNNNESYFTIHLMPVSILDRTFEYGPTDIDLESYGIDDEDTLMLAYMYTNIIPHKKPLSRGVTHFLSGGWDGMDFREIQVADGYRGIGIYPVNQEPAFEDVSQQFDRLADTISQIPGMEDFQTSMLTIIQEISLSNPNRDFNPDSQSDWTLLMKMYREHSQNLLIENVLDFTAYPELEDAARYPITAIVDTGYPLRTKYKLIDFLNKREEVCAIISTYQSHLPQLTEDEDLAVGQALYTRMLLTQESVLFGTQACRGTIITQSGVPNLSVGGSVMPCTLWVAKQLAKSYNTTYIKQSLVKFPNSLNNLFKSLNWYPVRLEFKNKLWGGGLNYCQFYDRTQLQYAALKSIYPEPTSKLVDFEFVYICCFIKHIARLIGMQYTGSDEYVSVRHFKIQNSITNAIDSMLNGKYGFGVTVDQTVDEAAAGYIDHVYIRMAPEQAMTVLKVDLIVEKPNA